MVKLQDVHKNTGSHRGHLDKQKNKYKYLFLKDFQRFEVIADNSELLFMLHEAKKKNIIIRIHLR